MGSSVLEIHGESAPSEILNSLSFTSATLALSLSRAVDAPVLSFFCRLRSKHSRNAGDSGPMALWKALNGQLVSFILERRKGAVDLSFLGKNKKIMEQSTTELKWGRKLFEKLVGALSQSQPQNKRKQKQKQKQKEVIFIIIDSFSRLGGDSKDLVRGEELLQQLAGMISETATAADDKIVIKLLVTDTLPSCRVRRLADLSLRVPDEPDGWRNGVSVRYLEERREEMVGRFLEERGGEEEEEEDSDEDDSSEEDSDEDDEEEEDGYFDTSSDSDSDCD